MQVDILLLQILFGCNKEKICFEIATNYGIMEAK